ncbi:MAG: site-specific DNA-methyltransferase [Pirellulales bacterium]|nr:site-specific DNA-methyltransferase [Pirellulales bacterium]
MYKIAQSRLKIRCKFSLENDVTLFHGDCIKLLKKIPDKSVQLVVTSPPYNVGKSYENRISFDEYLAQQKLVIAECVRVLKIGGSLCWQVGHHVNSHQQVIPLDLALHPLFAEHDLLRLRNRIIWHFEHGLNCKHRFSGRHETILWYTKGDNYRFNLDSVRIPQKYPGKRAYKGPRRGEYSGNPLGKNPSDVWIFPNVKNWHVEKTEHPCQFPIELPERLILALTKKGDLVLDPYLGAGTTAVAAIMHARRVAGSDLVISYLKIARQRIKDVANGRLRYRPLGKPVYIPEPNTALTTSPFSPPK